VRRPVGDWRTELEAELRAVGREVDVPPAPDLTTQVRRRLAKPPVRRWFGRPSWRIAFVVVVVLLGVLVATPQGRAVIVDVFRFAGVELRTGPGPTPSPASSPSLSGEQRMSLEQARKRVVFPILVPAALGSPDEVVVSDGGRVVSLTYHRTAHGELRVDEFDGHLDPIYQKFVDGGDLTEVRVNGRRGIWIKGPHELMYVTRDGKHDTASARLTTGNTLIWDTGRVALRLEGALQQDQALGIALSAR
jgi:hypothetical protein